MIDQLTLVVKSTFKEMITHFNMKIQSDFVDINKYKKRVLFLCFRNSQQQKIPLLQKLNK